MHSSKNTILPPPYSTDDSSLEKQTIVEQFTSSGPGGQNKNKTQTSVRLKHLPSGLTVIATRERSFRDNLRMAFERLKNRLEVLNYSPPKRRPTRPTRTSVEKRIGSKNKRSSIKELRKKNESSDF